jgi:hypothetical protein
VTLGTRMKYNWFRGHSKTWNELTPLAFRKFDKFLAEFRPDPPGIEINSANYFRKRAEVIIKDPPKDDDYLHWLMYMQHYGLPTRLLDWSENVLIAAFFAVVTDQNDDGELWTLYPKDLNMKSDINGVVAYRSFIVKGLSRFPFVGPESDDSLGSLKMVITPIAFSPKHIFPRAVAQESAFTIHKGSLEGEESKSINDVLPSKKSLARYIIPKIETVAKGRHYDF